MPPSLGFLEGLVQMGALETKGTDLFSNADSFHRLLVMGMYAQNYAGAITNSKAKQRAETALANLFGRLTSAQSLEAIKMILKKDSEAQLYLGTLMGYVLSSSAVAESQKAELQPLLRLVTADCRQDMHEKGNRSGYSTLPLETRKLISCPSF